MAGDPAVVILAGNAGVGERLRQRLGVIGVAVVTTCRAFIDHQARVKVVAVENLGDDVLESVCDAIDLGCIFEVVVVVVDVQGVDITKWREYGVEIVYEEFLATSVRQRLGLTKGAGVLQHPGADSAVTLGPDGPADDDDDLGLDWKEPG